MHKLLDFACDELEQLERKAEKGDLSMSDVQYADTLAHLKKNLLTADAMEGTEYSGDWNERDYHGRSYARGRGSNGRRDSMGRYYSRYYSGDEIDPETKKEIKRLADKLENM